MIDFIERLLMPRLPSICFAEQDATETTGSDDPEADAIADALTEGEETEGEEEEVIELEVGPKKFRLKKDDYGNAAKEAWDGMQRAHTERSEKISAKEREFQVKEQRIAEQEKIVQSFPKEIAKLTTLSEQIDQYQKADWAAMRMSGETVQVNGRDVSLADYHWGMFQNAQAQLNAANQDLQTKLNTEKAQREASVSKQRETYHTEMAAKVKDWTPQKDAELRTFLTNRGVPKEMVDSTFIAPIMAIAAEAMNYVKAMERVQARAATREKTPDEVPLTPPKTARANGQRKPDLYNAKSIEEYQKIRYQQQATDRDLRGRFK